MAGQELTRVLVNITAALSALHSPSSSVAARRAAQAELDAVKRFPPGAIVQISSRLLKPVTTEGTSGVLGELEAHFGFHLLEDGLMRGGWSGLNEDIRLAVRNLVAHVVKAAGGRVAASGFIKVKGASVLSAIAIREWPQRWPSFIEEIVGGAVPVGMACMVLKTLSEDVMEYSDVIEKDRKKELSQALTAALPAAMPFITRVIDRAYAGKDAKMMSVALNTLGHYLTWCPATTAFEFGAPSALCALLTHEHFRDEAADALLNFCLRRDQKAKGVEDSYRKSLFVPLLEFCSSLDFDSVDPSRHEFVVKITDLLCALGRSRFDDCFLASAQLSGVQEGSTAVGLRFFTLMLTLAAHPSLVICVSVIPFFSMLFAMLGRPKQAGADPMEQLKSPGNETHQGLATQTLRALTISLSRIKLLKLEGTHVKDAVFAELDYEDISEYKAGFKRFRSLVQQSIVRATDLCPELCFGTAFSALGDAFERDAKSLGEAIRTTRGVIWAAESVTAAVNRTSFFNEPGAQQLLEACFARLLACQKEHFKPLRGIAFRLFISVYKRNREALKFVLEALIQDHEKSQAISFGKNQMEDMAAASPLENLVVICRRTHSGSGGPLGEFSTGLCDLAVRSQSNLDPKSHEVRLSCMEAASYAILDVCDYNQRVALSEKILEAPMQVLGSERVISSVFSQPEALYAFLTKAPENDVLKVVQTLQLIERTTRRLVKPQRESTVLKLPNAIPPSITLKAVKVVSVLIKTLHALYDPNLFMVNPLDPERGKVLQPTTEEYAFLLNVTHAELKSGAVGVRFAVAADDSGSEGPGSAVRRTQSHLKSLRECAYEIAKNVILSGVTCSPAHFNPLLMSLLSHYEHMRPLHMGCMIKRTISVLLSYQVFQYHGSLSPESFTTYLHSLNSSSLPAFLRCVLNLLNTVHDDKASEEIELGAHMLSSSMASMLQSVYHSGEAPLGQDRKAPPLMSQEGPLTSCLWDLLGCIVGPDGGSEQGLALFTKLVEWAPRSPDVGMQGVGRVLGIVLGTAIVRGGTEIGDLAERSLLAMIEKWGPVPVAENLVRAAAQEGADVLEIMREGAKDLVEVKAANGAGKKAVRDTLRKLLVRLEKLASQKGWSTGRELVKAKSGREKKVKSLSEKSSTRKANAARFRRQIKIQSRGEDEVVLADFALDSLYGKGPPL